MKTSRMTEQELYLEKKFNKYGEEVFAYAEHVFKEKIIPYLEKYNLEFLAGNGTFWIGYTNETPKWFVTKYFSGAGTWSIDVDKIDSRISKILQSEIPGMSGNDLGSIMPCYPESNKYSE